MSKLTNVVIAGYVLCLMSGIAYAEGHPNIGRSATESEIAAWDIDVRPDFKGLPVGSGSVGRGQEIWESRCASCHGVFGESNEVFTPLIGGTTKEDILSGRVAALANNKQPQRTTIMKVPTVSTLWDYIHRAMPWNAPKSLSNDDVFAVVAYLLSLAEIVPEDFVLSDKNIAEVQKRMPNRNGMTRDHGMWEVNGKPDVKSVACMKDCNSQMQIRSSLPEVSKSAHGNLKDQNRTYGPVRGADTPDPSKKTSNVSQATPDSEAVSAVNQQMQDLARKSSCLSCHGLQSKLVGPGFSEISSRYKADPTALGRLVEKVKSGGSGNWGSAAMPSQKHLAETDIQSLVTWILAGAK
jgi:cytochrome c551/c552